MSVQVISVLSVRGEARAVTAAVTAVTVGLSVRGDVAAATAAATSIGVECDA